VLIVSLITGIHVQLRVSFFDNSCSSIDWKGTGTTIPDVQGIDTRTEGGRFVVHYEGMCQGIQAARPISKRLIVSKLERHSVSYRYLFHLGLQVDMGEAANLPRADLGFRPMVRRLLTTVRMRADAKRAGRPRPL
jgi:hypothetical protein